MMMMGLYCIALRVNDGSSVGREESLGGNNKINVISESLSSVMISITNQGEETLLTLTTQLPQDAIEPLFSGAAWAGTRVWHASSYLCNYLQENKRDLVENKVCVELGSGLALPSFVCAFLGAKLVYMTEQDPLDKLLQVNIDLNVNFLRGNAKAKTLNWARFAKSEFSEAIDVILISDCIFQHLYGDSWKHLANVIYSLKKQNERSTVLNCLERRLDDGVEEFLAYCKQSFNMEWKLIKEEVDVANNYHLQLYEYK